MHTSATHQSTDNVVGWGYSTSHAIFYLGKKTKQHKRRGRHGLFDFSDLFADIHYHVHLGHLCVRPKLEVALGTPTAFFNKGGSATKQGTSQITACHCLSSRSAKDVKV